MTTLLTPTHSPVEEKIGEPSKASPKHLWVKEPGWAKCPFCGQWRQTLDGKEYWVVTLGCRQVPKTYDDFLYGREPEQPDPDVCVEHHIIEDAPLRAFPSP